MLLWFLVRLTANPTTDYCSEGTLLRLDPNKLPLDEFIVTSRLAIPFVLSLADDDERVHDAVLFYDKKRLLVSTL